MFWSVLNPILQKKINFFFGFFFEFFEKKEWTPPYVRHPPPHRPHVFGKFFIPPVSQVYIFVRTTLLLVYKKITNLDKTLNYDMGSWNRWYFAFNNINR